MAVDKTRYGGYYTKKEIKEVVRYAQERGINVIPEIEMPGHSQAAVSSYPEFFIGEQVGVAPLWESLKKYTAAKMKLWFLEDIIDEVVELFQENTYILVVMKLLKQIGKHAEIVKM